MSAPSIADYKRLGETREVVVKRQDLPLHCPTDETALWCSHPRVSLAIERSAGKTARCPYCGTLYRLID
jgi:uncharacterized Zn-finger protein